MKHSMIAAALSATVLFSACGSTSTTSSQTESNAQTTVSKAAEETQEEVIGMKKYEDMITELPPEGYDQKRDGVSYPQFEKYSYYSHTAERDTNVNVLLPADYDENKEYPVLYILHGFYNNEDWMSSGSVALSQILRQHRIISRKRKAFTMSKKEPQSLP